MVLRSNPTRNARGRQAAALALCLALAGGCTAVTKTYDDVMGRGSAHAEKGRFYVARANLPLHAEASFASKQIAELELNEAVERQEIEHGFAHVRVVATGQEGWVDNAKLNWRETSGTQDEIVAPPPPELPEAEPAVVEAEPEQPAEPKNADLSPPTAPQDAPNAAAKRGKSVDPALFDAF